MAPKVTSSRNRSTRKASKPPTTGQNPGRANRQSISQAKVTASGGGTPGSAKVTTGGGGAKPPSKPVGTGGGGLSKPNGRQPRAITNGNNPAIRQLRAKAIQAQRQAQGKSTVASRNPGITPESAKGQRMKQMSRAQRVIGDSGYVRAAEARGKAEVAKAQARRGARAAMKNMSRTLQNAKVGRALGGGLLSKAAVPLAMVSTIAGMKESADRGKALKERVSKQRAALAGNRTKFPKARQAAISKAASIKGSPVIGAAKGATNAQQFDSAFKAARKAGASTFSWKGKRYTTKKKGE